MFRSFFLYLSNSRWARRLLLALPFATRVSSRFVAGETLAMGLAAARALNEKGITVALDLLGESVHNEADAMRSADEYIALLEGMEREQVRGYASLKLTALGLDISEAVCLQNMRRILTRAMGLHRFIRIDMEGSAYTERTLVIFRELLKEYPHTTVGVVIQSYLKRSEADMHALAAEGAFVRLVKGAYKEPPTVAFPEKKDVDESYLNLMRFYLSEDAFAKGARLAIATHDQKIIDEACNFTEEHKIDKGDYEFQMLYGVRSDLQHSLVEAGYQVRAYVPYGTQWYPYFMRRLAERPANVWFILKNFFKR